MRGLGFLTMCETTSCFLGVESGNAFLAQETACPLDCSFMKASIGGWESSAPTGGVDSRAVFPAFLSTATVILHQL